MVDQGMLLESFRKNDIGSIFAWFPALGDGPESQMSLTYLKLSQDAFYKSCQQIEQLESSIGHISQGNEVQSTVGLWFIAIEAYINSILRIVCAHKGLNFKSLTKRDLGQRIRILFEELEVEVDKQDFYSGTFQKLSEFSQYRNELFHDRTGINDIQFNKTLFSGNPLLANQVDVMQAALISMEVFQSLKFLIPDLNLTPQVIVHKNDSFFYARLDDLFEKVLVPFFQQVLKKHSLETSLDFDWNVTPLIQSNIFENQKIEVLIKATPDQKFIYKPSSHETKIGERLFTEFKDNVVFDTEKNFKLGTFYR